MTTAEHQRLIADRQSIKWKKWGPYLSERQWATVREDYSASGNVWDSLVHDMARSKAYRWGEDGIGGFSNDDQRICFSWAFWNHKDSILKERIFGLTSHEGNHGEDVKEYYYYLDSTPTHSYMKMLYKYPLEPFPYSDLVVKNEGRSKLKSEFELIDTGIFEKDQYCDVFLEYAKKSEDEFLFSAEVVNRSDAAAEITVLPTLWMRNTWSSGRDPIKPKISEYAPGCMKIEHHTLGEYFIYFENTDELVFCDNETNRERLYKTKSVSRYPKDGINDYVVSQKKSVNPKKTGTKASSVHRLKISAKSSTYVRVRMSPKTIEDPWSDFGSIFEDRKREADEFYNYIHGNVPAGETRTIQRQAFAGMMWSKQFYYYNLKKWLEGDPGRPSPAQNRKNGRNKDWAHMFNYHVISMPDKWEYPWYAAWDLAFHTIPIARIDADFAKQQLLIFLNERYQHPNGQIPAYEWNFSDVNPPVHAWAVLRVFQIDKDQNGGKGDFDFLQKAFHKLLINFTWWVNRKDENGNNIFEGGFLGLDNIGVFDRSDPAVEDASLEQADSTSWMGMFALNMLRISLDLAMEFPIYQDMALKFYEHFLYIGGAMNSIGSEGVDLWDDEENFYYDVIHTPEVPNQQLKVRSMVGLIPLYAVEILTYDSYKTLDEFRKGLNFFFKERPELTSLVSRWENEGVEHSRLLSIMRGFRLKKVLEKMLSEKEFLSDFGIRALSKYHLDNPYEVKISGKDFSVSYLPGESDSSFFGGNSNWRGPVWFPVNFLILESLLKFHQYYGDEFKVEFPTGSGNFMTLKQVVNEISGRLLSIFKKDSDGNRPTYGKVKKFQEDPNFRDHILFYEYFHGDNGTGLGASHQTGWTGLVAEIIHRQYNDFEIH